jgi:signal transduction histidine kinase
VCGIHVIDGGDLRPAVSTSEWRCGYFDGDVRGNGLGLAIVGRTVDALPGTYAVKSSRDEGSRFCIRLPLATPRR